MVSEIKGNIFDTDCDIIAHQVNCMGVMGTGIALDIRNLYPYNYTSYKALCSSHLHSESLGGQIHFVVVKHKEGYKTIANLFGQFSYGRDKRHTDYDWLEKAISSLADYCKRHGCSVAFPYKMGCKNAGGDWKKVSQIIYNYFGNNNTICKIYKL